MNNKPPLSLLKRVHYFSGKLLSPEDFTVEQTYWLEKFRRHNRHLHGWGIVSGLEVSVSSDSSGDLKIVISPGLALDPLGNEIVIPNPYEEATDCKDKTIYVCLYYAERKTDKIPVVGQGEELFDYSRIEESFEIKFERNNPRKEHTGGIALARLRCKKGGWQIDKKFRRPRCSRSEGV